MPKQTKKASRQKARPVKNTLADFRRYLIDADRSPRTVEGYSRDLTLFARWFEQSNGYLLTPERLTPTDAREYKQKSLHVDKASPATINRRLAALRAYVSWALDQGFIEYDPVSAVTSVDEQPVAPKWLTRQEQARVTREVENALNAARSAAAQRQAIRDQAIVTLLLNTGLRVGELCALDLDDVKISDRTGEVRVRAGKGTKTRTVPLNKQARRALQAWLKVRGDVDTDRLFVGKRGELTQNAVQRQIAEYGRRARVEMTPHVLRHTFAKNLVNANVSMEKVAALLGHRSLNTTKIYTLPSQADLDQATQVLEE